MRTTEKSKYEDRRRHQPHPRKYEHGRKNVKQWIRVQWEEENIQAVIGSAAAVTILIIFNLAALKFFEVL